MSITKQVGNLRAGYIGETAIDYYLQFLPPEYHILHNLRLHDLYGKFQIDTLMITQNFILILEVKNISGVIIFDEMGQMIRQQNDDEENFGNPIAQVNLQHIRLRNWLSKLNLPPLPIKKLIVFANSHSIIKNLTKENHIPNMIIKKELIPLKIKEFTEKYSKEILFNYQFQKLSQDLIESHKQENIDILKRYNLSYGDCIKGVFCPVCNGLPMKRVHAKWLCTLCETESRKAHIPSLYDYYFLFGSEINNQQAREFLQLESPYVTKDLLKNMGLQKVGKNKGRKYIMKTPEIQPEFELDLYVK